MSPVFFIPTTKDLRINAKIVKVAHTAKVIITKAANLF